MICNTSGILAKGVDDMDTNKITVRIEQPNKETIEAMLEAERIASDPSIKHYFDVEQALKELKK